MGAPAVWVRSEASPALSDVQACAGETPQRLAGPSSLHLQAGWQERDLLLLVLSGMQRQGPGSWAAVLGGWAAAVLDGRAAAGDAGAAMLQRQGMRCRGWAGLLLHSPARLVAASRLLAVGGAVLLQRPAADFHGWGADGLHVAHLHPPPGLVLLRWAAALGWARLGGLAPLWHRLAPLWHGLAGPLAVVAEAARVVARAAHGAFVTATRAIVPRPALLAADGAAAA